LLTAEICLNLDWELLKTRLESSKEVTKQSCEKEGKVPDSVSSSSFSTIKTFSLIDIRGYRYLDMDGIQIFMETYFKYMINKKNGFDPSTIKGTGFYLDTRPKFMKAIMRRLGVDSTQKISFREFADLMKPSPPDNVAELFRSNTE